MKAAIRWGVRKAFTLPFLRPALLARLRPSVSVLMYHGVVPDESPYDAWTLVRASEFERQLAFLGRHFTPLRLDQALHPPTGLRKPGVVVTFDDGLRNNLKVALPLLEAHGIPATVFACSEAIETQRLFWWDRIILAVQHSRVGEVDLHDLGLGRRTFAAAPAQARWGGIQALLTDIQSVAYEARETVADHLATALLAGADPRAEELAVLSVGELRELASSELVTIGSHTHGHDLLTKVTPEVARASVRTGIEKLEGWLGLEVRHFAYPGGLYSRETVDLLRESGVASAVTTRSGTARVGTPSLEIPRISMGGYDSPLEWKSNLLGLASIRGG